MRQIALLLLLGSMFLHAVSPEEIDIAEKNIDRLHGTVQNYYRIIRANRIRDVFDILEKYPGERSTVVQRWFDIVFQPDIGMGHGIFLSKTQTKVWFHLEQMLFDPDMPISQRDHDEIKEKLASLTVKGDIPQSGAVQQYRTSTDVNLRTLPIVSRLTRISSIAKGVPFEVCCILKYRTAHGRNSLWGYARIKDSGQRGWVNLRYAYPLRAY